MMPIKKAHENKIGLWVSAAQQGDAQAFGKLYNVHHRFVTKYLKRHFLRDDPAGVDEVVQETALTAHEQINRFKGESRFSTWLIGIARNKALTYLRQQRTERAHQEKLANTDPLDIPSWIASEDLLTENPALIAEHRQLLTAVERRFGLNTGFAEAALAGEGYSVDEITRVRQIPEGTVKTRLFHFRAALPNHYKPD